MNISKEKILKAIKGSHGIISTVADKLKCEWHTAQTHINKHDETKQALIDENEAFGDFVELKAMGRIKDDSEQMIRFYLATKFKKRGFTERQEITGAEGSPIQTENTDKLKKVIDKMDSTQRKMFFEIIEQNNGVD